LVVECPTCHNNICVSTAKRATPGIRLIAGGSGDQSLKFAKAAVLASTFESQAQDEVARATATLEAAEAEFGVHTTDLSLPQEKLQSHQSLYEYVSSVVWKRSPLLQSINVKQAAAVIVATAATAVKQVPIPFQVVTLQYLLQTAAATTNFKRYHELLQQLGLRSPPTISSSTFMNQISQYISKKEAFNVENASYQQAAEEYAKIKAVAVAMMKSSENDVDDDLTIVKTLNQRIQQIVAQRERKRMTDEALRRAKDEVATALRRRAITTPAAAAAVVGSVDELRKEEYFLRTQIPLALADQAIAVRRESQEAEIARLQSVVTAATERMNTAAAEVAAATERCRVADEAVAFIVNVANRTIEQTIIDMTSITNAVLSDLFPGTSVSINIRKKGAARTRTGGFVAEIVISTAGGGVQHDGIGLLSGGETDRISLAFTIALAVLSRSPFLLLDECMASLDSANRRLCFAAIRKYLTNKKMVINVCHDEDEGGGYYDHVVTVT
jgi:ABC-type molybdenum transport system ATPase subunit/photorepair protein PhrA